MTEIVYPLLLPAVIVAGFTWQLKKSISNTQRAENPTTAFIQEKITLKVFKGNEILNIAVENSSTPQQIGEIIFKPEELINKVPIVIWNGKKLFNEMSIGLQGVKNGQFLHIQKVEKLSVRQQAYSHHNIITLVACSIVLTGFWWIYIENPEYFSFFSRLIMIAFTELLVYLIFKVTKNFS